MNDFGCCVRVRREHVGRDMNLLVSKRSWLLAPALFLASLAALLATWFSMEPSSLLAAFDADGYSFFELLTIPFFALIVPAVWLCCPFSGTLGRKSLLCMGVTCVAVMAVVKELDLHLVLMHHLYPDLVDVHGCVQGLVKPDGSPLVGTPFKMRFVMNGAVPLGAKAVAVSYFILFFGVFAAMLSYYLPCLVRGFFRMHPVAWTMCFFGLSGVMVQICDRLPAWYRHLRGISKDCLDASFVALCTALEEGGEMMVAAFALIAILQAHAIYAGDRPPPEFAEL